MTHRVGIREFRGNLSSYLRMARDGQSLTVMSHDEVVAEIHPPSANVPLARQPGALRGKLRMADDFDTLPDEVLAAMEGAE